MNNEQNESSIDEPPAAKRLRQMYTRSLNEVMVNDDEDDVQILTNNNNNNSKKHLHEKISQIIVQSVTATIDLLTLAEKYENECKVAELRLKGVEERNVALEKDLAAVKRALEAKELELEAETRAHGKALEKVRIAEAKLVVSGQQAAFERMRVLELERQVAIMRARADKGHRLMEGSLSPHEKKMEELRAALATQLKKFNRTAEVCLWEASYESRLKTAANFRVYDEYQKKLLEMAGDFYKNGFGTCLEQLQNLGHLPECFPKVFLPLNSVAIEPAQAEEGQRLKAGSLARYEKKMEELSAVLATRLEEFNKTAKIRLMESELRTVANCWVYDEYQKKLLALAVRFYKEGFTTCLEQLQNLGHFPKGLDISFLNVYADGMDRLDGEDGASAAFP